MIQEGGRAKDTGGGSMTPSLRAGALFTGTDGKGLGNGHVTHTYKTIVLKKR